MSLSVALSARPTPLHTQHQRPPLERATTAPARPGLPRRSSSLHKALLTRLRPLPFQYIFSLWHTKSPSPSYSSSTTAPPSTSSSTNANPTDYSPTLLVSEVPDIATFYRIFNNVPWPNIRARDSIHFFRSGVRPLWEDEENLEGGCWVLKLRREDERGLDRAVRAWEEICVMCLGGMVQAEIATGMLCPYRHLPPAQNTETAFPDFATDEHEHEHGWVRLTGACVRCI